MPFSDLPRVRVRTRRTQANDLNLSHPADTAVVAPPPPGPRFEWVPIESLSPADRKVRKHPKAQLDKLISVIKRFGYIADILIDGQRKIIDGHLLCEALKKLGHDNVRVQVIEHLSEAEIETLRIAQHALMEMSGWDDDGLKLSVEGLFKVDALLIDFTGLPTAKVDGLMLSGFKAATREEALAVPKTTLLKRGDCFIDYVEKGTPVHRLVCGDAKDPEVIAWALNGRKVRMLLADFPYGMLKIEGVASGKHGEFAEGSSMTEAQTLELFRALLAASTLHVVDGGSVFLFIDHRAMFALTQATRDDGLTHVCTAVLDKQTGGMGGLYRHQVEFVLVLAKGARIAVNNVKLGKYGRNRTTLWSAPGMAQFGPDRDAALEAHPTVKSTQVCADAILDVTNLGEVVLDPCMGSGTTIIAAHRVNRVGIGVELDPVYFEVAVRRLEAVTGRPLIHEETGLTLEALLDLRAAQAAGQA